MKINLKNNNEEKIEVVCVEPISPHNEALYETGKELLKSSISTGRDFCKFMITLSTGAIPTYLALLQFVLPEEFILPPISLGLSIIPPFLFLASSIIFVLGYLPTTSSLSLDIIEEIQKTYNDMFQRRKKIIFVGLAVFLVGSISAILSVIMHTFGVLT